MKSGKEKDWIELKAKEKWLSMMDRCGKYDGYLDVVVCEEWKDFNKFHFWFRSQVDNGWYLSGWEIDKDIIGRGTNIYSPEHCAFVPKGINMLFIKAFNRRYKYFGTRGVKTILTQDGLGKNYELFVAEFTYEGKKVFYGEYDYELFAFFEYKFAFEEFLQNKTQELKENLNPKMHEALMTYRVLPLGYQNAKL